MALTGDSGAEPPPPNRHPFLPEQETAKVNPTLQNPPNTNHPPKTAQKIHAPLRKDTLSHRAVRGLYAHTANLTCMKEPADEISQTPPENQTSTKKEIFNVRGCGFSKQPPEQTMEQTTEKPTEQLTEKPSKQLSEQNQEQNQEERTLPAQSKSKFILVPEIPPDDEEDKGIVVRDLPLDHCRVYPIWKTYEMQIRRAQYIKAEKEGELDVEKGPIYELYHDGVSVCEITVELFIYHNVTDEMILDAYRRGVSNIEKIPYEMLASPSPKEIPPWERKAPVRKIETRSISDARHSLNEDGYAHRFEEECRGWLIYDTPGKEWYAWNNSHWEPAKERLGLAKRFVADTLVTEMGVWKLEAEREEKVSKEMRNEQRLKELNGLLSEYEKHITYIHQTKGLDAMAKVAASTTMGIDLEKEGTHTVLTFQNGGVDCVTGKLLTTSDLARKKNTYPIHYIDRWYDPNKIPENFEKHLLDVFTDNTTEDLSAAERERRAELLKSYFKRLLGYALTPGNRRNLFVFLWGTGANGKSTTIDAIREAIPSEIATVSSKELLTTQEEKPTPGLFKGLLKRIMYFAEISDSKSSRGPKISSESVKILAGEKKVNTRTLYKDSVERLILCLPIAATNELPSFDKEPEDAILRRIVTLPFMHKFSGSTKRLDIGETLEKEADAIFSMMIHELQDYLAAEKEKPGSGLPELPAFCRSKQAELLSGPSYDAFVQERIEPPVEGTKARVPLEDIKQAYISWCYMKGIPVNTRQRKDPVKDKDTGEYKERHELTKGETTNLNTALKTNGYKFVDSSGRRYYRCRIKHE